MFPPVAKVCAWLALLATVTAVEPQSPQRAQGKYTLAQGDVVPPLVGKDLDGASITIDYSSSSRSTIVYVITPFGPFVVRNERAFSALLRQVRPRFDVVVLSTQEKRLRPYVSIQRDAWGPGTRVVHSISNELYRKMYLGGYPQTLVISNSGRVLRNFPGAYDETVGPAVERFFRVRLPK